MTIDWKNTVIPRAATTIRSYETRVTLRQLYYRFISDGVLPSYSEPKGKKSANERNRDIYKGLARECAKARREGYGPKIKDDAWPNGWYRKYVFPPLTDDTRTLYNTYFETGVSGSLARLLENYRLDRQAGQKNYIYLGVEKETLKELLVSWFGEYGFPIIVLKGSSSQDYVERIKQHIQYS